MNLLSVKRNSPITAHHHKNNSMLSLQRELNKAVGDFFGFEPFNFPTERFEDLVLYPAVDIVDDNEKFKAEFEMPGMGEEDVKVSVDNGMLIVKGEKKTSRKDKDKNYMMREISYGSYERKISLPDSVDIDKAKASFKKGMLWVEIPKKPECSTKTRDLEVEKA